METAPAQATHPSTAPHTCPICIAERSTDKCGVRRQGRQDGGEIKSSRAFLNYMSTSLLILGDLLTIAVITVIGFATHGEAGTSFLPRMAATFVPLAVGWFALAPALGLFEAARVRNARQLWRPALAAFFAAQLAVILRGLWLNAAVLPLFGLVLGATSALGMFAWRGIWMWAGQRK